MKTDPGLKADVLCELSFDPSLGAARIEVAVRDGAVTLSGTVTSYREKAAAKRAAGRVRGLRALTEDIAVDLPEGNRRSDIDIATAIRTRFTWDASLADQELRIHVADGMVTLSGRVDDGWQRTAAVDHVTPITGVTALDNAVTLRDGPANALVQNAIRHALNRSTLCDDNIEVRVTDGVVHLTGTAQNWLHKEQASATAWSAVGTRDVLNEIRVN